MSEEILVINNGLVVQKLSLSLDTPLNEVRTHLLDEFKNNNFLLKIFPVDIKCEKAIKLKDIYDSNLKMIFLISPTDFPKMISFGNPIAISESQTIQNTPQVIQTKQKKNDQKKEEKNELNQKPQPPQPKEAVNYNEKENEEVIRKFNKKYAINISTEDKKIALEDIGNAGFSTLCKINFNCLKTLKVLYSINTLGALVKARFANTIKELNLNQNFLKEIDELAECNLPCLEKLELEENAIKSFEPLAKCNFPNLNYLSIGTNNHPDVSFLKNCKFPNLKELFLFRMGIEEIDVLAECNFPELEQLNFAINKIKDIKFLKKCNFKKLKILNFKSNEIENVDFLPELNYKLKKFYPYDNQFTSYEFIKNMDTSEMVTLFLGSCSSLDECHCNIKNKDFYENVDIKFLEEAKFPKLTTLNLSHIQFKELPVLSSENYPNLEDVNLNFTCFSDMSPLTKWKAKKLKSLSFIGNKKIKTTNENVIAYNELKKDNKELYYHFYQVLEDKFKSAMVKKDIKKNTDIPDELYKIHPHDIQLMNGDDLPIKTKLRDDEEEFVLNNETQYENYIPYYYCEKLCSICRRECKGKKVFYCGECNIRICMECKDLLLKNIHRLGEFHKHELFLYYNRDNQSWRCDKCKISRLHRCDTPRYRCSLCDEDFCLVCAIENYAQYEFESQHPSRLGKVDASKIDKNIAQELQNLHEHQFTFFESITKNDYEDFDQCGFCKMKIEGQKVIRCQECKANICMNCQKRIKKRDETIGKKLHSHELILCRRHYRCDKCIMEYNGFAFTCEECNKDFCINCFTNTKAIRLDSRVPEIMAQLHNAGGKTHFLKYGEFNQLTGSAASYDFCKYCKKSFKNQKLYYCNECQFRTCEDCSKLFTDNLKIVDEDPNYEIKLEYACVYDCSKCKKKKKDIWKFSCLTCKKVYCPDCVFAKSKPEKETKPVESKPEKETKPVDTSSKDNKNSKLDKKDELINIIHPHKIDFGVINNSLGVNSNRFNCLKCKKNLENKNGYLCKNCPITLCEECYKPIMEIPEKSKLHSKHQLIMCGGRNYVCDICRGRYSGLAFTCKACNFDSCYNCYTTKGK